MKSLLTMMVFAGAVSACSNPQQEPAAAQMTPAEKTATREAAEVAPVLDSATMDGAKQTLLSEGKACAQVVALQPREAENKMDVICIETAGGTKRVTYTIDLGAI